LKSAQVVGYQYKSFNLNTYLIDTMIKTHAYTRVWFG